MKINLVIISLIFLISCNENQKTNWCEEGKKEAQEEIENGGLIFIKYLTLGGGADRYDKELEKILNKSNIRFKYEAHSCIEIEGEDEKHHCYENALIQAIEYRYGNDFIEKISKQADEIFANRENYLYEDSELDKSPYFINQKGEESSGEELVKYLNKYLKYPKEYQLAKTVEERPFVELIFIVDKEGKPKDFKIGESNFPEEKEEFREYFEREVLQIISKIPKWEAGTIHNKKVDCKFTRRIPLDWII